MEGKENCGICLEAMDQDLYELPCTHIFHTECIKRWFEQQNTCPYCRATIVGNEPEYEANLKQMFAHGILSGGRIIQLLCAHYYNPQHSEAEEVEPWWKTAVDMLADGDVRRRISQWGTNDLSNQNLITYLMMKIWRHVTLRLIQQRNRQ